MGGARGEQDIILGMPKPYQPGPGPSAAVDREFGGPYSTYRWNPRDLSNLHEELLGHDYFKSLAKASLLKAQEAEKIADHERNLAEQASLKAQELKKELEQSLAPKPAEPAEPKFNEYGQRLDNFGRPDLAFLSPPERKAEIKSRRKNTSNKVSLQQIARKQPRRL